MGDSGLSTHCCFQNLSRSLPPHLPCPRQLLLCPIQRIFCTFPSHFWTTGWKVWDDLPNSCFMSPAAGCFAPPPKGFRSAEDWQDKEEKIKGHHFHSTLYFLHWISAELDHHLCLALRHHQSHSIFRLNLFQRLDHKCQLNVKPIAWK